MAGQGSSSGAPAVFRLSVLDLPGDQGGITVRAEPVHPGEQRLSVPCVVLQSLARWELGVVALRMRSPSWHGILCRRATRGALTASHMHGRPAGERAAGKVEVELSCRGSQICRAARSSRKGLEGGFS